MHDIITFAAFFLTMVAMMGGLILMVYLMARGPQDESDGTDIMRRAYTDAMQAVTRED